MVANIAAPDVNPAIVRSYDIRGRVGSELHARDAHAIGLAFATVARGRDLRNIAVCRDGRLSSPALEISLIEGLLAGGATVHPFGLAPTPFMHFAVRAARLDGGVMVTASHNPGDHNGFKLMLAGEPVHGDALKKLVATPRAHRAGGTVAAQSERVADSIKRQYVGYLASEVPALAGMRVVWDCGNGVVGAVIGHLTRHLPGSHRLLNANVDGRFPSHHPDPSVALNLRQLQAAVLEHGADVGFAFDGDGDRLGVVDSEGRIVWPDQILVLLASEVLSRSPGATIVGDVKSSRVLFEGVRSRGGKAIMAPSGYVLVRDTLLREAARLAGEMSGHILFADCRHRTDDALFAAVRVLAALRSQGVRLTEFVSKLPQTVTTPELRIACVEDRKSGVIGEVAARLRLAGAVVDETDGLRVTSDEGWWLLRQSGTEPKLTARCEAVSTEALDALRAELSRQLRLSGVDPGIQLREGSASRES